MPAVLYGGAAEGGRAATPIAVQPKALLKILHSESGANTLIALKLAGAGDARVLVKEYQLDPITHQILHADFYRVAMDRLLRVTIPVTVTGEPKGVKQQGGILEFIRREIEIECLPADIPEHVAVDVSELMLHQGVRVRDIAIDPKWKAVSDADMMLVHVIMPKAEEVAAPAEAAAAPAAAAEPEVIKKGKKDETEEEEEEEKVAFEGDRRPRQPGRDPIRRHAAQRRIRGRRRAGAARRTSRSNRRRSSALIAKIRRVPGADEPVLLAKPMTFMNASGQAVGDLLRYFKIDLGDVLVLVDEVQLPLAKLRARSRGSAGGHNGLKSIVEHVGENFSRLRVGVGRGDARRDLADHVLARFDRDEEAEVERMTSRAADAAEMFIASGIAAVMNGFNGGDPATTE